MYAEFLKGIMRICMTYMGNVWNGKVQINLLF